MRSTMLSLCLSAAFVATAPASPRPATPPLPISKPKKVMLSAGVAQRQLIEKVQPIYPADAKAAGIQGTVVLKITINTEGAVEDPSVVSGPEQLRQSAIDAVKQWRYKPYLLNGAPVSADTIVNIVFSLKP